MGRSPARAAGTAPRVLSYPQAIGPFNVKPYFKMAGDTPGQGTATTAASSWTVPNLCNAYSWPTDLSGGGVIAIVELGGGWIVSDISAFFKRSFPGQNVPLPQIADVSVDGTKNTPNQNSADGEVALDIQVAAASYYVATGKPARIQMYWSQDIAAAVRRAADDGCDVCSISWGSDESNWGAQAGLAMEEAAAYATKKGMIVFAASGDNDSSDGGTTPANVDLPSSCPHVIGCGGTRKTPDAETVWNNQPGNAFGDGTGGGYSTLFPMPSWQAGAPHGPGRMVPDVAANADPVTGYEIILHGDPATIGGTSAVAPLYAGLFAAFGTELGFVTPEMWLNHLCFNDIQQGDNGKYRARKGPDPCTGIGSPIGSKLAELLAHPAASAARRLRQAEAEIARLQQGSYTSSSAARDLSMRAAGAVPPSRIYPTADPNTVIRCYLDPASGRYDLNCQPEPAAQVATFNAAFGPMNGGLTARAAGVVPPYRDFPTSDPNTVIRCWRDPVSGRYDSNCQAVSASQAATFNSTFSLVNGGLTVRAAGAPPLHRVFQTDDPSTVIICDLDPATGRYDLNRRLASVS
jgi:kumamolisin